MPEHITQMLQDIIEKYQPRDEEFMVNDWAGGNIDDAYELGFDDGVGCGRYELACTIFKVLVQES